MATENFTAKRYNAFLAELSIDGNITRAANAVGVDRSNAYQRRLRNPEFAKRWDDAIEAATDAIEAEAHRRAVTGVEEPVFYKGIECGRVTRYSDSLLLAMLRAKRAKEYGDASKIELTGADGGPVKVEESPIEIARTIAFALALGLRVQQSGQSLA